MIRSKSEYTDSDSESDFRTDSNYIKYLLHRVTGRAFLNCYQGAVFPSVYASVILSSSDSEPCSIFNFKLIRSYTSTRFAASRRRNRDDPIRVLRLEGECTL